MLEELIVFFIVLILSLLAKSIVKKEKLGAFYPFVLRLRFIGVAVHEFSHYIMNLAVGIKPEGIKINWRVKETRERNPHGMVITKPRSFLQGVLICLEPFYVSTWLVFLSLTVMFSSRFNPILRIIAGLFCISLILGAAPSGPDFNNIPKTFRKDPHNSLYQIFLLLLSGVILWIISLYTQMLFFLDVFYYLAIAGLYLSLKFSFLGIHRVITKLSSRDFKKPAKIKFKRFTRPLYKPKKPQTEW
ncbi:MAG: hypothetical protein HWN81_02390 [Candidatus Lokiarchaeota archaeon]|nr:hypothetical protein [Candidatus Lokiarchaeota archaeon]